MGLRGAALLALLCAPQLAAGAGLRARPASTAKGCRGVGLLSTGAGRQHALEADEGVFADGYSRVACEVDVSPMNLRLYFKEHACGGLPSCRLTELPMTPRLCFDFCRQHETAKFFGLKGGKCYCVPYFHAKSLGGEGECNFACEGDQKEMCGGRDKTSLFEMHMCGNSADEATIGMQLGGEASTEAEAAMLTANTTVEKANALAGAWPALGVCSVDPEGKRVCAYGQEWAALGRELIDSSAAVRLADEALTSEVDELSALHTSFANAGQEANASLASNLEQTTASVRQATAATKGVTQTLKMALARVAGPLGGAGLDSMEGVFKALGDTEGGWHAQCALEPIKGASYLAQTADDPKACAKKCLATLSGVDGCVGFNYQYKDGLAACQLLRSEGLVKPSIAKAVPIFEISTTKRDAMGIQTLSCFTHGAFMAGHASGPLTTHVVREISDSTPPQEQPQGQK